MSNPEHAPFFFNGWYNIGRSATLAFVGFLALIVVLRLSGKRTLSKMNVFDFVFVVHVLVAFTKEQIERALNFDPSRLQTS